MKLICPICKKEYQYASKTWQEKDKTWKCCHDDDVLSSQDKVAIKRHQNADLSHEALKMAAEQKRRDTEIGEGKEITVTSVQPDRTLGSSFRVPEKVVESIKKKVEAEI